MPNKIQNKILRLPDVKALTGLSRSYIYEKISKGDFPAPISLGERAVGWLADELEEWIQERMEIRNIARKDV